MIARGLAQTWHALQHAENQMGMMAMHLARQAGREPHPPAVAQLRAQAGAPRFWAGVCGRAITAVPAANDP